MSGRSGNSLALILVGWAWHRDGYGSGTPRLACHHGFRPPPGGWLDEGLLPTVLSMGRECVSYTMSSADLIRELKSAGWQLARVRGSHHVFTNPRRPGILVVPHPRKDLGSGLVRAILRQAGL